MGGLHQHASDFHFFLEADPAAFFEVGIEPLQQAFDTLRPLGGGNMAGQCGAGFWHQGGVGEFAGGEGFVVAQANEIALGIGVNPQFSRGNQLRGEGFECGRHFESLGRRDEAQQVVLVRRHSPTVADYTRLSSRSMKLAPSLFNLLPREIYVL